MIKWHTEKKIRWHMGFIPFAKFCISRLINKIYSDGQKHTAADLLGQIKSHQRIDSKGRKILFIDEIKTK